MLLSNFTDPKRSNFLARLLAGTFSVGIALGTGIGVGLGRTLLPAYPKNMDITTEFHCSSHVSYERLEMGMTIGEVEAILGQGTEVNRSATVATFIWDLPASGQIEVIFEHGKLKNKAQCTVLK